MSSETKKKRNYCFTWNNYKPEDVAAVLTWKGAKYIVFGEEKGASGTPHLQGYVEWAEGKAISPTLLKLGAIHWEERKATAASAAAYCKKGDQSKADWDSKGVDGPSYGVGAVVHEIGLISNPGKRSDIKDCAEMIMCGASIAEVAAHDPGTFVKYHKGFAALKATLYTHRTCAPTVMWKWGLAGSGKTRSAVDAHPDSHYIKDGTKWWNGYEQQQAIIIDDFHRPTSDFEFRALLQLLDRYHYQGEYKGGCIPINSPYIYITCEFPPSEYWKDNELAQVMRRISSVEEIKATI